MTVAIETLRSLVEVDPFGQNYQSLGEQEVIHRFDQAGLMKHLTGGRMFSQERALAVASDGALQQSPETTLDQWFYRGQGGQFYLKGDILGRVDGSKISDAAVARIGEEDPDAASDYKSHLECEGGASLFRLITSEVRRHDLAQRASKSRGQDLADPEEVLAQKRGRAM